MMQLDGIQKYINIYDEITNQTITTHNSNMEDLIK